MQLKFYPYDLRFSEIFAVSSNARTGTDVIYVELESNGFTGYGEASFPPYMKEKRQTNLDFLEALDLSAFSAGEETASIENYLNAYESCLPAKAALDMALLDLKGKISGTSVQTLLGITNQHPIATSFTIGIGDDAFILRQLNLAKEFKTIKVKLGGDRLYNEHAIGLIKSKSSQFLGVDFNQGLKDKQEALEMIKWLKEQGVLYVEQPLPDDMETDILWLKSESPLDIYGDESIQTEADIINKHHLFHGINIKLMKCGGISNALKMVEIARSYGLKLMLGCMAESTCAITAAANIAPLFDKVDLDGHLMVTNDLFTGIQIRQGELILENSPGIGVRKK